MAFSRMCLSTEFGVRGISKSVIAQENGVIIFKGLNDFIKSYEKILRNDYRYEHELAGREYINKYYSNLSFDSAVDCVIA